MTMQEEQRIKREWGWSFGTAAGQDDDGYEPAVETKTAAVPSTTYSGLRFQRCGGGRRVIRRKTGGD